MDHGLIDSLRAEQLIWLPELGIGWYPVTAQPYVESYWENYRRLDQTPSGDALTAMRIALVAKYWDGEVIDVGIGGGRFVADRQKTYGFDVNPHAVDWLRSRNRYLDPHKQEVRAATFWDSLEHVLNPSTLLNNVTRWAFVSTPIYRDTVHLLGSKHLKKAEHCWYFSRQGLATFMERFGFELVEQNAMEQAAGREDIETFVFRRR